MNKIITVKRGNTSLTIVFVTFICIIISIYIVSYIFNIINVFICYQKLNNISLKYMFILEKYGYLTQDEKDELFNDLQKNNIDTSNVVIDVPEDISSFGTKLDFVIEYKYKLNRIFFSENSFGLNVDYINISVKRSCYSKV